MAKVVGMDLGTTNSVVAVFDGQLRPLQNREGENHSPSVVTCFKEQFITGTPAMRYFVLNPENTIISVKRLMGRAISDPEVELVSEKYPYKVVQPSNGTRDSVRVIMGGNEYSPEEVSAMVLAKLKEDAELVLGEEVTHAVITVPAYFSDRQKKATREAGIKAGLKVMKLLDEPMAAALAFGLAETDDEPRTVLVYDLGGGTFDTTVLIMGAGNYAQIDLEGDMWLGGDNFDQLIIDDVVLMIEREHGFNPTNDLRFMATLRLEARKAKEALGASKSTEIIITDRLKDEDGDYIDVIYEITQERFMRMSEPLVDRTMDLVTRVLDAAQMGDSEIDVVVMAGSASAMPLVQQKMTARFGKDKISRKVHPKHSVAMGAALLAANYGKIKCPRQECGADNDLNATVCEKCGMSLVDTERTIQCPSCQTENDILEWDCIKCGYPLKRRPPTQIAPFDYAIETAGDTYLTFVNKGDLIPTSDHAIKPLTVYTRYANQQLVSLPYFGMAEKKEKQGEALVILDNLYPKGTAIHLVMRLNRDAIVEIQKAALDNGTSLPTWVMRGEEDQLVVERWLAIEGKIEKKATAITPEDVQHINASMGEGLKNLQDQRFSKARQVLEDLDRYIDEIGTKRPPKDPRREARNLSAFTDELIKDYGELMPEQAALYEEINSALKASIVADDVPQMEQLTQTLDAALNLLPGKVVRLVNLHYAIRTKVRPWDPAAAADLEKEMEALEKRLKQGDNTALIDAMETKVNKMAEELAAGSTVICPKPDCRHPNPRSAYLCEKCGSTIHIADSDNRLSMRTPYK